ncbi:MAG: pilus assembly protein TadD [Chitinophagia bacterium]|nr:pilus assembly protein TadD [Chitinophagia bacterium]
MVHKKIVLIVIVGIIFLCLSLFCTPKTTSTTEGSSLWRNVYDTTARYVGMNTCKGCHEEVYKTFIETGMGKSFGLATPKKSAGDFSPAHALVYDSALNYYYKPFWRQDSLFIMEYRIENADTVHCRLQWVRYIVGSGQHTNSHIIDQNGYLYQAPITFYTQKHRWDLAPGFERGENTRFKRMIELECMSCHNAYPQLIEGSVNKYANVPLGIDCERCHGPGSLHVADKMAGKIIDTAKEPDYTIVNPRRLSTELQNNLCQRCHLQGIAVLNDKKTFFDFRPGMHLSEVMNVYMPEYEGAPNKMIMASHVERMKKSRCYVESGKMSCISCHNPHISVKVTPQATFINACLQCHNTAKGSKECKEKPFVRATKNDNCITCHMPKNGSIDIPHVAVTDHYIRAHAGAENPNPNLTAFLGMRCYNNAQPGAKATARAFIEFYERYAPTPALLDSALFYCNTLNAKDIFTLQDLIRIAFLKKDYRKIITLAEGLQPTAILDAWTAYRVAEALHAEGKSEQALVFYKQAVALKPYALDFVNQLGMCYIDLQKYADALQTFEQITAQNSLHVSALTNLGYTHLLMGNAPQALHYMQASYHLDPDNVQNLINMAIAHHAQNNNVAALQCVNKILSLAPGNLQAQAMKRELEK